jgi:DNA-binding MarR family transcriptional regulator
LPLFTDEERVTKKLAAHLLQLDNQLCFALYAASRAIIRTYREKLDPLDLTYPQYLVLTVLWEEDGLSVSELGNRLDLDSGTLTPLIKRLSTGGFVTKQRSEIDEREVRVRLTTKGKATRRIAVSVREHVVRRIAMSESEIKALRNELMSLVGRIGQEADVLAL